MFIISKWKILLVTLVTVISIYYSLPTFINSEYLHNKKVNLGLDLRGGAYILLEVDLQTYEKDQINKLQDQIRLHLKNTNVPIVSISSENKNIIVTLENDNNIDLAKKEVHSLLGNNIRTTSSNNVLSIIFDDKFVKDQINHLMSQTIEIVRRRIDESATKEIDIQRQGDNFILLQVPGLENPDQIKRLLGKTAKLTFHLVEGNVTYNQVLLGNVPMGVKVLPFDTKETSAEPNFLAIQSRPILSGDMLLNAQAGLNLNNPVVTFKFNNLGAKLFGDVTSKNVGKPFAIVLDNKIISAPVINEPILGGSGQISGSFTIETANELALLLRAGALPAPLKLA